MVRMNGGPPDRVRSVIGGSSVRVPETLDSPGRSLEEPPDIEKARPEAGIAPTEADRGNDRALLIKVARPDLPAGTRTTESPECGTGSRPDYLVAPHLGTSPSPVRSPSSTQLRLKLAANAPS